MKKSPSFEKLVKEFPDLFMDNDQCTCPWGLECSEGWHPFIYELIKQLDKINKSNQNHKKYNPEFEYVLIKVLQIKEKFGTLRCYISGDDRAFGVVSAYEHLSQYICEYCGITKATADVKARGGSWLKCLCKECHIKYQNGYRA